MSIADKRATIESTHPQLSISRQCSLLKLHRSSYYRAAPPTIESERNQSLMRLIDEEYTRHPFYGSRKITRWLKDQGEQVSRKLVQRLMRLMRIQSVAPKPNTSLANKQHKKFPYLLKDIEVTAPNQAWCTDITYIRIGSGFVYLTAVMDWHTRYVLSWEVSVTMETDFCINAVQSAIRRHGKPQIFNSDQGAQYTSHEFTNMLESQGIEISMDGKGGWADNVLIERLWRSVKHEEVYTKEYSSVTELVTELKKYFEFYNQERRHWGINQRTPAEAYFDQREQLAMAA